MSAPHDFTQPVARRAWIRQLLGPIDEAKWNELARELFAWQFNRVPAYQRLCLAHDFTPEQFTTWREIPAVPQQLFKRKKLFAHGSAPSAAIYETSGTTTGQPGRQHLLLTDIYQAVSVEGARRVGLFSEGPAPSGPRTTRRSSLRDQAPSLHFLTPSPAEAPRSSLSAMFGFWQKASRSARQRFWVRQGQFEFQRLREVLLAEIKTRRLVALSGTAFSFVHLIDAWADLPPLRLPPGSWLLETGGFKGRSREIPKAKLYAGMARTFTVDDNAIWNEYGMSELSSQAYAHGTSGLHQVPPWARVLVCNPATGREVGVGQRGLIRWIDLANTDSVLALQTLDLAERTAHGFQLMGRLPRTEARGCSLSAEDLVSASTGNDLS